jgi:hypothetical protein
VYKLWSFSLCSVLQPPATSSLLGPNILLSTLFLNIFNLSYSLSVRDQMCNDFTEMNCILLITVAVLQKIPCVLTHYLLCTEWVLTRRLWPSCSPYLNVCDFYLWGNILKSFINNPCASEVFKIEIWNVVLEIMEGEFWCTSQNLCWCEMCLDVGRYHIQQLFYVISKVVLLQIFFKHGQNLQLDCEVTCNVLIWEKLLAG